MRFTDLPTPCFIIDENRLVQNLAVLRDVARRSGAKILLAQKAFSMFSTYPLLREYLAGTTASGLFEARLGHEEFGGETHVYSPAYTPDEFHEILNYADHIVFNSFTQWKKYGNLARVAGKSCGLRLNPECSTQPSDHAIYDPCGPTSRLGITEANFQPDLLDGIEGFHFHTLCEQNADDLVRTVAAFEMRFGRYMEGMKWLNLGGGHHITRADYDVDALVIFDCHCNSPLFTSFSRRIPYRTWRLYRFPHRTKRSTGRAAHRSCRRTVRPLLLPRRRTGKTEPTMQTAMRAAQALPAEARRALPQSRRQAAHVRYCRPAVRTRRDDADRSLPPEERPYCSAEDTVQLTWHALSFP